MKKATLALFGLLLSILAIAQTPQGMSYQAVIRDASGILVTNQSIGFKISILQGSDSGTIVYQETHLPTTNTNGLISLVIGNGSVISGVFETIDWANGPYFIKTETDINGGSNYTISGTSQMLSVPYALYAESSGTSIYTFSGSAGIGPYTNNIDYVFVGNGATALVTVKEGQKICGNAEAPLATTSGIASVSYGLGYQLGDGTIAHFYGGNFSYIQIGTTRTPLPACGCTSNLPAGIYKVGVIIRQNGIVPINANNYVNGWVMVTN
jgi:hypothetical protein